MKTYIIERNDAGSVTARVQRDGVSSYPLAPRLDLMNHSPTGFEYGYGGSGPAQLALALCADALAYNGTGEKAVRVHQWVKNTLVARWDRDVKRHEITEEALLAVIFGAGGDS